MVQLLGQNASEDVAQAPPPEAERSDELCAAEALGLCRRPDEIRVVLPVVAQDAERAGAEERGRGLESLVRLPQLSAVDALALNHVVNEEAHVADALGSEGRELAAD